MHSWWGSMARMVWPAMDRFDEIQIYTEHVHQLHAGSECFRTPWLGGSSSSTGFGMLEKSLDVLDVSLLLVVLFSASSFTRILEACFVDGAMMSAAGVKKSIDHPIGHGR